MEKLAVTGSPGVGKSTVCHCFQELGVPTFSADVICHELLAHDSAVRKQLLDAFGDAILTEGQVDRAKLGNLVFPDQQRIHTLEKILHTPILREVEQILKENKQMGAPLIVGEIPLLFEAGWASLFDHVLLVTAAHPWRVQENMGLQKQRMWPETDKRALADFRIANDGSLDQLQQAVEKLFNQIKPR